MEVIPEAGVMLGAAIATFVISGIKRATGGAKVFDRVAVLATMAVGIGVAFLLYGANVVDGGDDLNVFRVILAGFTISLAASGARSQFKASTE
jgi:hypothetical protein